MLIHKSHSKCELIKIVEAFNLNIQNPRQYKKMELCALIVNELKCMDEIATSEDYPFLNIIELRQYLIQVNPKKRLTIKQKNNIVLISKKIKQYCRSNFNIEATDYKTIQELYQDAKYISNFGEIPSVRMAIKELNSNPQKLYHLDIYIPPLVQRELDMRKKLKVKILTSLKVHEGNFVITFD